MNNQPTNTNQINNSDDARSHLLTQAITFAQSAVSKGDNTLAGKHLQVAQSLLTGGRK